MKAEQPNGTDAKKPDSKPSNPLMSPAIKNLNDLQRVLCDQIEGIIAGTATAQNVNAITNAAGKIISVSKMKLEVAKAAGRQFEAEELTNIEERKALPSPKKKAA